MHVDSRPAIPRPPARQEVLTAYPDSLVARLPTFITVLTAVFAVLIVAAATVAFVSYPPSPSRPREQWHCQFVASCPGGEGTPIPSEPNNNDLHEANRS
jgi:hypothetical protein